MTVSDDTKLGKKTWKSLKEDVLKYRNDLSKMPYDWFKKLTKDKYDVLATLVKAQLDQGDMEPLQEDEYPIFKYSPEVAIEENK